MKTVGRIVLIAAIVCAIYFATIGREEFNSLIDFFSDLLQVIADNYLRK